MEIACPLPPSLGDEGCRLLERLTSELAGIEGVVALALGGSHARGSARPDSDMDVVLYYRQNAPLRPAAVRALAGRVNDRPAPIVTGLYEWGPWVNGGAWLVIGGRHVDLLYRNYDQCARVVEHCRQGRTRLDYAQQPPYGFWSHIYLGELFYNLVLHDPTGLVATLKAQLVPYPPRLKQSMVSQVLWAVQFTLLHARQAAERGDVYVATGCLGRAAMYLTQALFALNEVYFVSDKGAAAAVDGFALRPAHYAARLSAVLCYAGDSPAALSAATERLQALFTETATLARDIYRPRYDGI